MPNQVQSKNQNSNIELLCQVYSNIQTSVQAGTGSIANITTNTVNINELYPTGSGTVQQTQITGNTVSTVTQGLIRAGNYSLSTTGLQKNGLNIAVEEFLEPRPARKAVQHTLQGIFVDSYDIAPPMLTLMYAVEMPQATNFTTTSYFTPRGTPSSLLQTSSSIVQNTSAGGGSPLLVTTQTVTSSKPPKPSIKALSFAQILNVIYSATSARNTTNNASLFYHDYTRNVHHQISLLNVTFRAAVNRQNILIVQVDAVVTRPDFTTETSTSPTKSVQGTVSTTTTTV